MESPENTITTQTRASTKLPTVRALIRLSIASYRTHVRMILMIVGVPIVASIAQVFSFRQENFLLGAIITLIAGLISFCSYLAFFAFVTGNAHTPKEAWSMAPRAILPVAVLHIYVTLVCFGGFLIFVVPGFILAIALSFSLFVFFAENIRGREALIRSWLYVRGYWWGVFFRTLVIQCIWIALLIAVGILLGITSTTTETTALEDILLIVFSNAIIVPINMFYMFELYRALKQIKQENNDDAHRPRIRRYITIFTVVGSLGIAAFLGGLSYFVYEYSEFLLELLKINTGV